MTQSTAADGKPAGLGRYRFRETLSTSFFGPRYRVLYEGTAANSDAPPAPHSDPSDPNSRPAVDSGLALRLVEVDAPNLLERLAHAVQAIRDVNHPAVLQPLQIVRASTRLGIVTPDVEGVTLAKLLQDSSIRQESIPPAIALRIVRDLVGGLQALSLHGRGVRRHEWHYGGITPDSIHVGLDGQTRYLDPGVASAAARQPCWSHEAAALAYTAPEQTGADASFDAVSDNFSLGVLLWELLTCRPLFGASTAAETLQRVHQAPIPRVQRQQFVRGEPIAFALARTVAQALRRDPGQRYATYEEFVAALEASGEAASPESVGALVLQALPPKFHGEDRARLRDSRVHVAGPIGASATERRSGAPLSAASAPTVSVTPLPRPESAPGADAIGNSYWPATAAWVPPPLPDAPEKITAFPIGDLLRAPHVSQRNAWSIGLGCAAVIGLCVLFWKTSGDHPPQRAAAVRAAPPLASPDTLAVESKKPALVGGAPNTDPQHAVAQQPGVASPEDSQARTVNPSSAVPTRPRKAAKPEPIRRVVRLKSPSPASKKTESATFIPNDI